MDALPVLLSIVVALDCCPSTQNFTIRQHVLGKGDAGTSLLSVGGAQDC